MSKENNLIPSNIHTDQTKLTEIIKKARKHMWMRCRVPSKLLGNYPNDKLDEQKLEEE